MKTIAIYHKDCNDGTTAAAVVLKKYPGALLFPLTHGYYPDEIEEIVKKAKPGDRIFTVDCVMGVKEFLAAGFKVTSIDHHAGIEKEYAELAKTNPSFTFVFDNSKSGASLSWSYFFPNEKMPRIVEYVEDLDLWKWRYGNETKDANNYVFMLANKPEEVAKFFDGQIETLMRDGAVISRYADIMIAESVKNNDPIDVLIGDHTVPLYNITAYKSEAGNELSKARGKAVGLFTIDGSIVKISFRSIEGQKPTALELAKILGGGGHVLASGAGMTLENFTKSIVK